MLMYPRYGNPLCPLLFKRIFGSEKNKDILITFLNDILDLHDGQQIQTVEFLSPIQDPDIASKKQSVVDVLCKDQRGDQIIIEMQVSPTQGFEKRAQYYAAKAYSRQTDKGGKYQDLKAVIFIAIADCVLFADKTAYKSDHVILDRDSYAHDLQDFSFTFIELPKFTKKRGDDLEGMVEKWCYFFKYADETTAADLEKIIGSDQVIKQAYEALDQFYWSEPELLAYEQEMKRVWDNQSVLDRQLEDAEKKGLKKGKEEGLQEGLEKGKWEAMMHVAQTLLLQQMSVEQVSGITGLSVSDLQKLVTS